MAVRLNWKLRFLAGFAAAVSFVAAQPRRQERPEQAETRAAYVAQIIDQAVNPLPSGYKGLIVGYRDDLVTVYRTYGVATVDGTVPLNQKTLFGIGSATKTFTATLLAVANGKGLALTTPLYSLLPTQYQPRSAENRYSITLLDTADHHAGLPKNEGHLFSSVNDLYFYYAADPITCDPSTQELVHDCGCCDPAYMSLLGQTPTCGGSISSPVYRCSTHAPTQGASGWMYSNLGFEVLGATVATWLGYPDWNHAIQREITVPLNMPDTMPLESFGASQVARAANHCDPATRASNTNCQLLDWLPVGNGGGGLFSTASDMLEYLSYNTHDMRTPVPSALQSALPVIHQTYSQYPQGGQELAWQNFVLATGELYHWKDGSNGPFNSWVAYVTGHLNRRLVILDNSGANTPDLAAIAKQIMTSTGPPQ